ncbi:zinc finger protein [Gregarina niphandrodes]|uniref:Zinc finger protein n=1 Tax=Gregarina niphandrodes TaxID=110365 RepID=A0A023BCX6_GRENI|nr:zinc finger protein [Gregarina niphandrodes]EZG86314.1 zinc finger protein [Gregarina niphandrodes]|eukprot:XP_011128765.1 zinc finger protein [Gregarina niphandrodes]
MTRSGCRCFKTKQCKFWLEGRCTRGESCTYAHTDQELRPAPNLKKTKMCARWRQGQCALRADECSYAHGVEDLRAQSGRKSSCATESTDLMVSDVMMSDVIMSDVMMSDVMLSGETVLDIPSPLGSAHEHLVKTLSMSELSQGLSSTAYLE